MSEVSSGPKNNGTPGREEEENRSRWKEAKKKKGSEVEAQKTRGDVGWRYTRQEGPWGGGTEDKKGSGVKGKRTRRAVG